MKKKNIALKYFAIIVLLISSFLACDKDFASIDSDIINNENASHFNTDAMKFDVLTYNKKLDPIQTDNMPINMLGIYDDPVYGTTTSNIVSQIVPSFYAPSFGENTVLDSVVLTIPYYSTSLEVLESGETTYELDSTYGNAPIKLSIFENNYFLREFDPSSGINTPQKYYSNGSTGNDQIDPSLLEGLKIIDTTDFIPSEKEIQLVDTAGTVTRLSPSLRLILDNAFWQEKIIDKQGELELSNANNFLNYFRGLYFKAESLGLEGNAMLLNFANTNSNITMYYSYDSTTEEGKRLSSTYSFSFSGKRINFISDLELSIPGGNETDGDEKLYLKGSQGTLAVVDLFKGMIQDPETGLDVPELEYFRSKKGKWLINEANLVFYVDQASVINLTEPDRLYLYDLENGRPLIDYFADLSNTITPVNSRIHHLGKLERVDDDPNGKGIRYKFKITEHINNILANDSTNVKLGLAVSSNVNLEGTSTQPSVLTTDDLINKSPVSSLVTPLSTILYGNNAAVEEKKVYLEIFYTEPKN